ncbi:MAG: hypothetical protein ACRC7R_07830 [Sarcina sp.]
MRDIKSVVKEILEDYYIIPKDVLYEDVEGMEEILKDLNVSEVYEEELFHKKEDKRKSKKLTGEQIEQIINDNRSCRTLAKEYNVCATTISKIKNNKY